MHLVSVVFKMGNRQIEGEMVRVEDSASVAEVRTE